MEISVLREPIRELSLSRNSEEYVPPTGRGGAGSRSRSRGRTANASPAGTRHGSGSGSANRSRSATPGPGPSTLLSRERGRSPAPARTLNGTTTAAAAGADNDAASREDTGGERIEPEEANIDLNRPPAILRGVLTVHLNKPTKIRKIGVKLIGEAKTEWPEGIGARRLDTTDRTALFEEQIIFFDARNKRHGRSTTRASGSILPTRSNSVPASPLLVSNTPVPLEPAPEYTPEPLALTSPPPNNRTAGLRLEEGASSGPSVATSRASSIAEVDAASRRIATPDGYPGHPLENIESNVSQASLSTTHSAHSGSEERGRAARRRQSTERVIPENAVLTTSPIGTAALAEHTREPLHQFSALPRRDSSVGASALKKSANSVRSPSTSSAKSARFSLGSLLRGKSSSRPPMARTLSPESVAEEGTGRSHSVGLRGLKQVLHASPFGDKHSQSHTDTDFDSDAEEDSRGRARNHPGWAEFQAGVFEYAINIPVPQSLPPTIHTNHGSVEYWLKGFASRAGALTARLTTSSEVHIIAAPNEDDLEAFEPITVERLWETELSYKIVIHVKSAPIGGEIPVSITLHPLGKMKVYRFTVVLEEVSSGPAVGPQTTDDIQQKYTFYAKEKRIARTPTVRKHELLRIDNPDGSPLLPIMEEASDALLSSPLRDWIKGIDEEGVTTLDPLGPWKLEGAVKMPECASAIHFSTSNQQANITVLHSIKLCLRVEKGGETQRDAKGQIKRYDLVVEAPMHVLSVRIFGTRRNGVLLMCTFQCRSQEAGYLPTYTSQPDAPVGAPRSRLRPESGFHPHEMSEGQRAHLYRSISSYGPTQHTAPTSVSPSVVPESAVQSIIPPSYGYVQNHPEQAMAQALPAGS